VNRSNASRPQGDDPADEVVKDVIRQVSGAEVAGRQGFPRFPFQAGKKLIEAQNILRRHRDQAFRHGLKDRSTIEAALRHAPEPRRACSGS
jgi:hypothetical protein